MRVVGIDPGLKGALAHVDLETGLVMDLVDMPVHDFVDGRRIPDNLEIFRLLASWKPDMIVLEHVEPRPTDGRVSMWRFAAGFGGLFAACEIYDRARGGLLLIRPSIWKPELGVSRDKEQSLELARMMFPDIADMLSRKRDDGRAEALLLIEYFRRVRAEEAA